MVEQKKKRNGNKICRFLDLNNKAESERCEKQTEREREEEGREKYIHDMYIMHN